MDNIQLLNLILITVQFSEIKVHIIGNLGAKPSRDGDAKLQGLNT